jgi:hypothetical protein
MVIARRIRARLYHSCMTGGEISGKFLTLPEIANRQGWSLKTARNRQHEANQRRRSGDSRPGDLPEPDHHVGRTPVWLEATIEAWEKGRPGRGAGGGPKPRT